MASITFGSIVAEARGSVGLVSYSRNNYGAYAKTRTTPTNPNTAKQITARARVTSGVAAWRALTPAQRESYNQIAILYSIQNRVGMSYTLNGYNFFLRQYIVCNLAGVAAPTSGTAPVLKALATVNQVRSQVAVFAIEQAVPVAPANLKLFTYASPPRVASQLSFNPSTLRFMKSVNAVNGNADIDITANYIALYGAIAPNIGKLTTFAMMNVNCVSGEVFEKIYFSTLIAA